MREASCTIAEPASAENEFVSKIWRTCWRTAIGRSSSACIGVSDKICNHSRRPGSRSAFRVAARVR